MDPVDIAIVVLVALSALHGFRVGAATQILSFAGVLLGLLLSVGLVLSIDPHVRGATAKAAVALLLLVVPSLVLGALGRLLGTALWPVLRRAHFGALDAGLGTLVAMAGTLLLCWLLGSLFLNSSLTAVSSDIARSRILTRLDAVLPPVPNAFSTIDRVLSVGGFPEVVLYDAGEPAGPVRMPSGTAVGDAVAAAEGSTVQVIGIGCGGEQEGSGFVGGTLGDGDPLVVTNAHVIAGTRGITIYTAAGRGLPARVVAFDPRLDLALLAVSPSLGLHPLPVDPGYVARGEDSAVLGFPEGGPFNAQPAGVLTRFSAEGRDIYDGALTDRVVYELEAHVRPGNSGGPLVTPGGEVIGVVFSRSASNAEIGYALGSPAVLEHIRAVEAKASPATVGTQRCTG